MVGPHWLFDGGSRLPKWIAKLGRPALAAKLLFHKPDSDGYRMGEVNSHGESWLSERDFELLAAAQGAQPSAKNGRIPGLFRADQQTERMSSVGVLAERQELSPNPLCRDSMSYEPHKLLWMLPGES